MCDSVENITQLASPYRRQHCATPLLRSITPVDKSLPNIQFRIMTFHEFPTAIPYEPVVVVVTAFGDVYHFFFTFSLGRNNDSSPPESSDSCLWPLVSSLFFICRFSFFVGMKHIRRWGDLIFQPFSCSVFCRHILVSVSELLQSQSPKAILGQQRLSIVLPNVFFPFFFGVVGHPSP